NIPLVEIYDEPRYQFRGMHVDLARNFHSKDFVLDLIEQMATYKLNKLHLHMGDDEGWRLEIRGLPALTQVGAFRCHDLTETRCLLPQLGSGSDPDFTSAVNGFYTIADYKEILEAATARHIQVIPSFDMPGHSRAVIKSMEARYRRLMAEGKEAEANRYRLIDPEDTTKYYSIQFYTDNTINVCIQSTYDFIDKVIDEVKLVHQEAGHPLTRYHIGADETAGAWIESPACKKYMEANDIHDVERLGPHFIERLSAQLIQKGIEVGGWSDGLSHTNFDKMPERVQSNIWDVLAWGGSASAHKQVNAGWEVVLSTPDALYFDFPHEADPKESGYYWGTRRVNTRKVFSFMPGNIPVHAEIWKSPAEQPFVIDDTLRLDAHGDVISGPMKKGKSIAGIQGQLWSETARSDDWAEYQIYPRFMALAERAWSKPAWEPDYNYSGAVYSHETKLFNDDLQAKRDKDWARFTSILAGKEFSKLDAANIFYRIPTVGAVINSNGVLSANIIFPGMAIEYRVGSSDWIEYSEPVTLQNYEVGTEVSVRSRSMDGTRYGRSLVVSN
ncbi:MAG: hexosaminidase, partial [Flavobacteriales bacterium]